MDYNSHSWRIIVSDLIELNMQQEMQFRYCPLNWRLAEMKDFYVKKREKDMKFLIMLFDVTFYIYQVFLFCRKLKI